MKKNYNNVPVSISDILDDEKFVIPQFQRNVVWNHKRRTEFIRNLRNGDPFGIILVRLHNDRYELIDGLQRVSTIKDYLKNKFEYLSKDDVNYDLTKKIVELDIQLRGMPLTDEYLATKTPEIRKAIFGYLKQELPNYSIMSKLKSEHGILDKPELDEAINDLYNDFMNSIKIDDLEVFAINYTGPEENIPNVFYNLNTGGVQLSKYETYAALWSKPLYKIDDEDLLNVIENKYESLKQKSNIDVDYDSESLRAGISLFEYCYALGGVLRSTEKGYSNVIGDNSKSTDPLGFEVLSLVLGLNVNKADELHKLLENVSGTFLVELKNMIEKSMSDICKILKDVTIGLSNQNLASDSTYLLYHILVSYIREQYDINIATEKITKKDTDLKHKDLEKYLPYHYVYAIISDFWKTNRQVSDLAREINTESSRKKYWSNISSEEWDSAILYFGKAQDAAPKTIPYANKLFIDFYFKLKLIDDPSKKSYFEYATLAPKGYSLDFEHIVPKKILEKKISDLSKSNQSVYPISSIGNLTYLTVTDNRSKRDQTIYDFASDRPAYTFNDDYIKFIDYPEKQELNFTTYANTSFRDEYEKFIKVRADVLLKEFKNLVEKI